LVRRNNKAPDLVQNQPVFPVELAMTEDPGCCGSGTGIIDAEGRCRYGQRSGSVKMDAPLALNLTAPRGPSEPAIFPDIESHP
jgi:hypothetical protein